MVAEDDDEASKTEERRNEKYPRPKRKAMLPSLKTPKVF